MAYTINRQDGDIKPYVHQEYPRRMYRWDCIPCSVGSDDARAAKEAEGWSIDQVFAPPVEPPAAEPEAHPDPRPVIEAPRRGRQPKKASA